MEIPENITRDHILKAILKIDSEGLPKNGDSKYYDVIFEGKKYPPKLLISYSNIFANGIELDRNSFEGGFGTKCFQIIHNNNFIIQKKNPTYYLLGAAWYGNENSPDQTERFLTNEIWENGNSEKFHNLVNEVEVGDRVAIKSSYATKDKKSVLRIKAIGTVISNKKNGIKLGVKWDKLFTPFDLEGYGGYRNTFQKVSLKDTNIIFRDYSKNKINMLNPKIWIEKTIIRGKNERISGDRALGKVLLSPQKDKRQADIYQSMRQVSKDDIILHLIDNDIFSGISRVKKKYEEIILNESQWNGPAYLIELENYIELEPPLTKNAILNIENEELLKEISSNSEVFYTNKLELRQGAYLTPCPIELFILINEIYFEKSGNKLPYSAELIIEESSIINTKGNFLIEHFIEAVKNSDLFLDSNLILRFISSLISKPFVILSGLSGSGKTKLAQAFVQWICESKEQYKIVPVGADWTNREPLLGYPNGLETKEYITPDSGVIHLLMKAYKSGNENKPYFLILDEMNLSHVERYFADFLNIMESNDTIKLYTGNPRKSLDGITVPLEIGWPKNVFIIGTVNIDETTYMFSPKVLDRANVIEFRITEEEINGFLASPSIPDLKKLIGQGISMAESFLSIAEKVDIEKNEALTNELVYFFNELKKIGAEFGYRSATEIMQLAAKLKTLEPTIKDNACLDIAIMQKLLPKLHGSRSKLVDVLIALGEICLVDAKDCKTIYFDAKKIDDLTKNPNIKYPISFEKLIRMYKNVLANGFTSYAEA